MSVDARIRAGVTMIEQQLPVVDTESAYRTISAELNRRRRRRVVLAVAVAAALVVATGVLALSQRGDRAVEPAPTPRTPERVTVMGVDGTVSYVAEDGSRRNIPAGNVDRFAMSPDGQRMAYLADRGPDAGGWLWLANADGTGRHRIEAPCDGCLPGWGVAWSHDGTRLAYMTFTPGKRPMQVRVRTLATGKELKFPIRGGTARGPAFSPDDRELAMVLEDDDAGRMYVATLDIDLGITSLSRISPPYVMVEAPAWSADGKTLYYTATDRSMRAKADSTIDALVVNDLYAVGADGQQARQITHAATGERYFIARPYGNRFLISRAVGNGPLVAGVLSADGSTFTPLRDPDGTRVLGYSVTPQS